LNTGVAIIGRGGGGGRGRGGEGEGREVELLHNPMGAAQYMTVFITMIIFVVYLWLCFGN
jgi:hypothetical protein